MAKTDFRNLECGDLSPLSNDVSSRWAKAAPGRRTPNFDPRNAGSSLDFPQRPQLGRAAARIGGDLVVAGGGWPPGQGLRLLHPKILRPVVLHTLGLAAHPAEELLHRPVLQRMKADDDEHAARRELGKGRGQRALDRADLVV